MSISIQREQCVACAKCRQVCPGMLLYPDQAGKTYIKYPQDCWGCTACLKECQAGAIRYYLGADIGGKGTVLYTKQAQEWLHWVFVQPNGSTQLISINRQQANKY